MSGPCDWLLIASRRIGTTGLVGKLHSDTLLYVWIAFSAPLSIFQKASTLISSRLSPCGLRTSLPQ
jgi:hypothetical protein